MFQLSPPVVSPEILVAKGGTMWARNGRRILPEMPDFHVTFRNLLHVVNLRHGNDSRSEGRRAEDFSALKNPTASVGFEPVNLGTKGQHATSRPPKPLQNCLSWNNLFIDRQKRFIFNINIVMNANLKWTVNVKFYSVPKLDFRLRV